MKGIRKILLNPAFAVSVVFTDSVCAQTLNNVEIKSQAKLSRSELDAVLTPYVGREITVKTLQNLLNDLTAVCTRATAILPLSPSILSRRAITESLRW